MMDWDYKPKILELVAESTENIFGRFMQATEDHINTQVTDLAGMKLRDNKRRKGLYWEVFCRDWLLARGTYTHVWLLNEVPEDVVVYLKLGQAGRKILDNGIDLVAANPAGFSAIQCKWRGTKQRVDWKSLSTFVGLCAVTGPWLEHVVMTNCKSVTRKIPRGPKDKSICWASFNSTPLEVWLKMAGNWNPQRLGGDQPAQHQHNQPKRSLDEVRLARIRKFAN